MKNKEQVKIKFIIAEVAFFIVIATILFKCSSGIDGFKTLLCICLGSFVCGTVLNVILCFIDTRIKHHIKE